MHYPETPHHLHFFFDAVSMNIEKKVQSLQANSGLYAVRS